MKHHTREIKENYELVDILKNAVVCRIAINALPAPYIVPMSFGFTWEESLLIFFHCAHEGRKLDLLDADNRVGFELDTGHELLQSEKPCDWGMRYRSIIGTGVITKVVEPEEKTAVLDTIMRHYQYKGESPHYDEAILKRTVVLMLTVDKISGKEKCQ